MTFHDLFQDTLNVFTTLDEEVGFKTPQRSFFFLFAILKSTIFNHFSRLYTTYTNFIEKTRGRGSFFVDITPFTYTPHAPPEQP